VYWLIKAESDSSLFSPSSRLSVYPNVAAEIKEPMNGKTLRFDAAKGETAKAVNLNWHDEGGSTDFKVDVSTDHEFKNIIHSRTTSAAGEMTPPLQPGSYYWRVTGINPLRKNPVPSSTAQFEVQASGIAPDEPEPGIPLITYEIPRTTLTRLPASIPDTFAGVKPDGITPYAWRPVPNAKEYEVEFADNEKFDGSKKFPTGTATTFVPEVVRPGAFFLRLRAKGSDGLLSPPSTVTRLDVLIPPPEIQPLKDKTEKFASEAEAARAKAEFEFRWTPRPWAARYQLDLAMDENFATGKKTAESSATAKKMTVNDSAQFYYRVRALASDGTPISAYSKTKSVLYKKLAANKPAPTPTPAPTPKPTPLPTATPTPAPKVSGLQHPVLSAESTEPQADTEVFTMPGAPSYVPFRWKKIKAATSYTLQVSSDPSFNNILAEASVRSNDYVLQERLPAGRVYWRVRAEKKDRAPAGKIDYSDWSAPSSLNITYGKSKK
jgi:hypothetical protein